MRRVALYPLFVTDLIPLDERKCLMQCSREILFNFLLLAPLLRQLLESSYWTLSVIAVVIFAFLDRPSS